MVPTPVLDNRNYKGVTRQGAAIPTMAKMWLIRELYGPTDRYRQVADGSSGAELQVYKDDSAFMADRYDPVTLGSLPSRETTHVNDPHGLLRWLEHREGTDIEAFAQDLQTPSVSIQMGNTRP